MGDHNDTQKLGTPRAFPVTVRVGIQTPRQPAISADCGASRSVLFSVPRVHIVSNQIRVVFQSFQCADTIYKKNASGRCDVGGIHTLC
jgi:hypothetical protein